MKIVDLEEVVLSLQLRNLPLQYFDLLPQLFKFLDELFQLLVVELIELVELQLYYFLPQLAVFFKHLIEIRRTVGNW